MARQSKQSTFIAYLFIGVGLFFLLRELNIPLVYQFYSWQSLLMLTGIVLFLYGYATKNYQYLFSGTLVLGLGIHFHGLAFYDFWIDHWGVYPLIVGIAFLIRSLKTREGRFVGIALILFSILMIFSDAISKYFAWFQTIAHMFNLVWPVIFIIIGIYILKKK